MKSHSSLETTLTSLAMLKVKVSSGGDYLDYLRPFVGHVLSIYGDESVTDSGVSKGIREYCGLIIPDRTIQLILQRFVKEGLLKRDQGKYHILGEIPVNGYSEKNASALRDIGSVTADLISHTKLASERELTEEEALDAIVVFLSRFSIPCLKAYLRGTALPTPEQDEDWKVCLVSQYVQSVEKVAPERFESFMTVVQGHMLANALLCPDLLSASKSYNEVTFYFDMPLLLQFLGLEGAAEKAAIDELISLVNALDGKVACFSHTVEELKNSIRKSAEFVDSMQGKGTIVEEARRAGKDKADLILIAQKAEELIGEGEKIAILPTPPYQAKTHKFEIGEEIFDGVLREEIRYNNPKAREYDVKSVRSVYVLRAGHHPFSVEKCRAVLVTGNGSLSKAAYIYGKRYEQSQEVSTVITDFSLANTAWLKAPQGAPSLPRKEVLAFCYAALRPSNEFWGKVLAKAEQMEQEGKISARDHQLLRSDYHLQDELMKLTLGEDVALTDESVTKTVERVSGEIRSEEIAKRLLVESELGRVGSELTSQIAQMEAVKTKIFWDADRRAKIEAKILSSLITVAQILVAIFGIFKVSEQSKFGWVIFLIAILSGALRILGNHFDIKAPRVIVKYQGLRRYNIIRKKYGELGLYLTE